MMPIFKEKLFPNGKLITSGIMVDQEGTVLDFAKESGFYIRKKDERRKLVSIFICNKIKFYRLDFFIDLA